jgi:omega-amidase
MLIRLHLAGFFLTLNMEDKILKLTMIQTDIFWEDIDRNLENIDSLLMHNNPSTDVIVLPEMFSTGFSMNTYKLAEASQGKAFKWMLSKARDYNAAITGSIIFTENEKFYNRLFWVNPGGEWFSYDKRHLFRVGKEDQFYEHGDKRLIVNYKEWRICPLICYDLRFPVWSRNNHAYDLLIYIANWPAARNHVWNILLRARAIENQCFVVGVNRVGRDGENLQYIGESCVVHPKGYFTTGTHDPTEQVINCSISKQELLDFRTKFPALDDADDLTGFRRS